MATCELLSSSSSQYSTMGKFSIQGSPVIDQLPEMVSSPSNVNNNVDDTTVTKQQSERVQVTDEQRRVWLGAAKEAARMAGKEVRSAFYREKTVTMKSSPADLVTETDQNVEKVVFSFFRRKFPTHRFIGEETTAAGVPVELTDDPTWIIDPIDGTNNFVHSFPFVAVAIALSVNREIEVAVTYNAILDVMYSAARGTGAFRDGKRISVSGATDIKESLIVTTAKSLLTPQKMENTFHNLRSLLEQGRGIRNLGTAALNMCQIAEGAAEVYFEFGIHCWDMASGALIIREAGGVVLDTAGGPFNLMGRCMLAASSMELAQTVASGLRHDHKKPDTEEPVYLRSAKD
ncbi:inositol monophosphatase 1-like isoform X1 [Branchiostoma floridae]|uniref:Inositol-1-monophosphatase n=1 Tax=Branchiostoma floridae TaxID=7739 RepID=A0A9J7L7B0_BRAFL|nr:inositol monophosphatase 1-like isoform X1 [Branchiostoma floridae]